MDRDLTLDTIKQLRRAEALLDVVRDILVAGVPASTVPNRALNGGSDVVSVKVAIREAMLDLYTSLDEGGKLYVRTNIGADDLPAASALLASKGK